MRGRRELEEEAAKLREQHGGVLEVEDARRLQHKAEEKHVSAEGMEASTTEEVLRARGMSDEGMELYKSTLNHDQQAHASEERIQELTKGKAENADLDVLGQKRAPLTPEQTAVVLNVNANLVEDVKAGRNVSKVVPTKDLGGLFTGEGEYGKIKLGGDVTLPRSDEGATASGKVEQRGLDYRVEGKHPYVQGTGANKTVRPDVAEEVYQIDNKMTPEQAQSARVILGPDLKDAALKEAKEWQALHEAMPSVEIPRMYQLKDGELTHVHERARTSPEDPSTGLGSSASMGLRGENGQQHFSPNQELYMKYQQFAPGAELARIDAQGRRTVIATYDAKEGKFVLSSELSGTERARYEEMMHAQEARNAARHAQVPAPGA
jgi:hypothetical protein